MRFIAICDLVTMAAAPSVLLVEQHPLTTAAQNSVEALVEL